MKEKGLLPQFISWLGENVISMENFIYLLKEAKDVGKEVAVQPK